jgi:hypothetical protein
MMGESEIEIARKLFEEGWSGPNRQAPLRFMTEDAVMRDILGHAEALNGHEEIGNFYGPVAGLLRVWPEEYFVSENGVSLTWMAYIEITNDLHGEENRGKYLCGEGMSRLEFADGKVSLEIDYWNGPQGICDDRDAHFAARRALSRAELGAVTGG